MAYIKDGTLLEGDFVTTPENPLLSQQVVTSKGIRVPYTRHGKTGQNFLT